MKRAIHALLFSLLAMASLSAQAAIESVTLTFDNLPLGPLVQGDAFDAGYGFYYETFSPYAAAQPGDLVGQVVDGTYASEQCGQLQCPSSSSTYVAAVNDAAMYFTTFTGKSFTVKSLDASFLSAYSDTYYNTMGVMQLQGVTASGSVLYFNLNLGAPGADGYAFSHYTTTGAFSTTQFTELYVYVYACNGSGSCNAFSTDKGQYALDNLNVTTAVPEPQTWMMLGAGALMLGAAARRRRQA